MDSQSTPEEHGRLVGRGALSKVPNRFERTRLVTDLAHVDAVEASQELRAVERTHLYPDQSRTVITENQSPDLPFRYSLNPYRGCEHGCTYCYARPTHETLGMDAGVDFETKIMVKYQAPECLRRELGRPGWSAEPITLSGVTDGYQPVERQLRITRRCLEVMEEAGQPVSIITKNALILRDVDILGRMAERGLVHANVSVTTLDAGLARSMEPRTATPQARIDAIRQLHEAGIPVRVMVAPIVPGLTDSEVPRILEQVSQAGATHAGYVLLRLPWAVESVFQTWLGHDYPEKQERIESLIRSTRAGRNNDPRFGSRMRGTGAYATQIARTFKVFATKHGLNRPLPDLNRSEFRPPLPRSGQLRLF